MDKIFIDELKVVANIGVWEWERRITQNLIIDIEVAADIAKAAQTDALDDSISYKDIARSVTSFVEQSEFRLIESVAQGIANVILNDFPTSWCKVTVSKPRAVENSRNVRVTIQRTPQDFD